MKLQKLLDEKNKKIETVNDKFKKNIGNFMKSPSMVLKRLAENEKAPD